MTNIVLTCFRDEADIIETFIEFYLEMGFDAVYAVDNGSVDGSDELVDAMAARGLPVVLRRDPRIGYERYLTEYFHWAGTAALPEWIFFLDADEFILFPHGAPAFLDAVPREVNCLDLRTREVWPATAEGSQSADGFLASTIVENRFDETTKQVARWSPGATVFAGKHKIDFAGRSLFPVDDPYIRHYKYRTAAQARRKEENRIQADGSYSDEELERISAFGLDASRNWLEECRRGHALEEWQRWFRPSSNTVFDDTMARWASEWRARR